MEDVRYFGWLRRRWSNVDEFWDLDVLKRADRLMRIQGGCRGRRLRAIVVRNHKVRKVAGKGFCVIVIGYMRFLKQFFDGRIMGKSVEIQE